MRGRSPFRFDGLVHHGAKAGQVVPIRDRRRADPPAGATAPAAWTGRAYRRGNRRGTVLHEPCLDLGGPGGVAAVQLRGHTGAGAGVRVTFRIHGDTQYRVAAKKCIAMRRSPGLIGAIDWFSPRKTPMPSDNGAADPAAGGLAWFAKKPGLSPGTVPPDPPTRRPADPPTRRP